MKTVKTYRYILACCACILALSSCNKQPEGWTVEGTIAGAADSTLFIEEPSGAAWIIIDSLKIGKNGDFSFTSTTPLYGKQSIYRLRVGDMSAYFPVENAETLNFTASLENMDKVHTLTGTAAAQGFTTVDSLINEAVERLGIEKALTDEKLLQDLGNVIIADTTCIVSYYTVSRPVENRRLFTTDHKLKLKLIGAAATKYASLRPDDVHGRQLAEIFAAAKQSSGTAAKGKSVAALQIGRPQVDFVRKDEKGQEQDLNAILDRGGVTVLSLLCYADPRAQANTAALGEIYEKYGKNGLAIYQISFDPNEAVWRQNASTMPWTTVYANPVESTDFLVAYNVNPLNDGPIALIFNRNGELVNRITNPADLEAAVSSLL